MKQFKTLLIAAILILGASQTINAQAKTAHVDVSDIMSKLPAMLDAQKQLTKISETYDADYKKMVTEYQAKLAQYEKEAATATEAVTENVLKKCKICKKESLILETMRKKNCNKNKKILQNQFTKK
jgi:outer membrane protein